MPGLWLTGTLVLFPALVLCQQPPREVSAAGLASEFWVEQAAMVFHPEQSPDSSLAHCAGTKGLCYQGCYLGSRH